MTKNNSSLIVIIDFQESRDSQNHIVDLERELGQQSIQIEALQVFEYNNIENEYVMKYTF